MGLFVSYAFIIVTRSDDSPDMSQVLGNATRNRPLDSKQASPDHEDQRRQNPGRSAIDVEKVQYKDQVHPSNQSQGEPFRVSHNRPAAIDIERLHYKDGMHQSKRDARG